jgi:hypothetical protein
MLPFFRDIQGKSELFVGELTLADIAADLVMDGNFHLIPVYATFREGIISIKVYKS